MNLRKTFLLLFAVAAVLACLSAAAVVGASREPAWHTGPAIGATGAGGPAGVATP